MPFVAHCKASPVNSQPLSRCRQPFPANTSQQIIALFKQNPLTFQGRQLITRSGGRAHRGSRSGNPTSNRLGSCFLRARRRIAHLFAFARGPLWHSSKERLMKSISSFAARVTLVILVAGSLAIAAMPAIAVPVYVPDNGFGTAQMPILADYVGETPMQIIDGLGGDVINIDAVLETPTVYSEQPGGTLLGTKSGGGGGGLFNWQMQGTGSLAGFNRTITFPNLASPGGVLSFPDPAFNVIGADYEVHAEPRTPSTRPSSRSIRSSSDCSIKELIQGPLIQISICSAWLPAPISACPAPATRSCCKAVPIGRSTVSLTSLIASTLSVRPAANCPAAAAARPAPCASRSVTRLCPNRRPVPC